MKQGVLVILCVLLALCTIQAVSAVNYEVDSIEISPTKDLGPGDRVTVLCVVEMTSEGSSTFPGSNLLEAYSELDDITWEYTILLGAHGQEITEGRRYLTIDGWLLSYPNTESSPTVKVKYYLEGNAPEASTTSDLTIFRLRELDDTGDLVKNGEYAETKTVVNPEDIQTTIEIRENELASLRTELDAKYAAGVNTAAVEEKYEAAEDAVTSAKTASYSDAQSYLDDAGVLIGEAEDLLDEAWTAKEIKDTEATIEQVDEMITYFKVNRSMSGDSRVVSIETQLDNANTLLTLAKDKQASGEFSQARTQANNANEKANTAYNTSLSLKEEIGGGLPLPGLNLEGSTMYIIIGAVLIVIVAAGIVLYRRHTKWDELG